MARQMTVAVAARTLGVSRKTIERRIKKGIMPATKQGRNTLVTLPDEVMSETVGHGDTSKSDTSETALRLFEDMKAERDHWRAMAERLSTTVAQQNDMIRQLTETKALPAPAPEPTSPPLVEPPAPSPETPRVPTEEPTRRSFLRSFWPFRRREG